MRSPLGLLPSRRELAGRADEDLMGLLQAGDARAFEVIFDRHGDVAFSLAYRMCGRRAMAEDIVLPRRPHRGAAMTGARR